MKETTRAKTRSKSLWGSSLVLNSFCSKNTRCFFCFRIQSVENWSHKRFHRYFHANLMTPCLTWRQFWNTAGLDDSGWPGGVNCFSSPRCYVYEPTQFFSLGWGNGRMTNLFTWSCTVCPQRVSMGRQTSIESSYSLSGELLEWNLPNKFISACLRGKTKEHLLIAPVGFSGDKILNFSTNNSKFNKAGIQELSPISNDHFVCIDCFTRARDCLIFHIKAVTGDTWALYWANQDSSVGK